MVLGLWGVLSQPYDSQTWSLFAAKWVVPFTLFHFAGFVFRDKSSLRKLEIFFLCVLTYLTAISVLFLFDGKSLIFPRFILDEGIGIHADRARGPFLQAVANGVCLNILGIIALDSFRRRQLNRWISVFLLVAVPLALLATRTRAVWLSAAISVAFLPLFGSQRRLRRAALGLCILAGIGISGALFYELNPGTLIDRLQDRSPLDFRAGMYRAGWEMFAEKPFLGWGSEANVQPEVAKRVSSFHPEYYVFHNTYLELAVEHGIVGLVLYAWLMICFVRLWKTPQSKGPEPPFLDSHFCKLWPLILGVYLLNASAVVMSYQFVNAVLFTIAGVLAARDHQARRMRWQPA